MLVERLQKPRWAFQRYQGNLLFTEKGLYLRNLQLMHLKDQFSFLLAAFSLAIKG